MFERWLQALSRPSTWLLLPAVLLVCILLVVSIYCAPIALKLAGKAHAASPTNTTNTAPPLPPESFPDALQQGMERLTTKAAEALKPLTYTMAVANPNVPQGHTALVTITASKAPTSPVVLAYAGKAFPVYAVDPEHPHALYGLVPIAVDKALGGSTLTLQDKASRKALASVTLTITSGHYSKQNIGVSKAMKGLTAEPGEYEAIGGFRKTTVPHRHWALPTTLATLTGIIIKPVPDCMSSPFGNLRYHNGKFTGNFHKGVDQRSPNSRPIKAITGGVVKIARQYRFHGGTIGIDHGQGVHSIYIHQSKIVVKLGDTVTAGQVIGHVGTTGFSTGPHLHWGLFVHGEPVNPVQWIALPGCG